MLYLSHDNIHDVRKELVRRYEERLFIKDRTGCDTIELIGLSFLATEPTVFGVVNEAYVDRETEWYMSQSLNVNDFEGDPPSGWAASADREGWINSNYGWVLFSDDNHNQYDRARDELLSNPNSRRAICIYTRPSMWDEYDKNGMNDFICTNTVQYLIREDKLYVVVSMRSNDVVWGYRNDYAWQHQIQATMLNDLNAMGMPEVTRGHIVWQPGSFHVYERHFWLVDCWRRYQRFMPKEEYDGLVRDSK